MKKDYKLDIVEMISNGRGFNDFWNGESSRTKDKMMQ